MKKSQLQKDPVQVTVQEIPLFKSSDNFWKYIDYNENDIQLIDTFFTTQNENLEQQMKKSCFKNMETLATQLGNHMHVNFTEQINRINEQNKQKEIELEKFKQMEEEKIQKQLEMLKQLQFQDNQSQQQEFQEENLDKQGDKISQSSNVQSQTSKQTKQSKEMQPLQEKEDDQGLYSDQKYWIFKNTKIDYLTFKSFIFQLKFTNIQTVKLSQVIFNEQEQNQFIQLIQQPCLKILYLEWTNFIGNVNNVLQELAQSQIQTLFLRNNQLQDENYQIFFQTLTQNEKLECLEIYDNNFGEIGLTSLCEYLTVNQTLQNLGLPKNNLKDVKQLLNLVKTRPFKEEDMADYQEKEKKRQEQQKSSKSTQKQSIIFPPLEKIVYIQDQVAVMNHKLMTINLSQNNIDDYDFIEELLQNSLNDFRIILTHNAFQDSQKRNLRQINQNKILI